MIADKIGVSRELVRPARIAEHAEIFRTARASSTIMDNSLLKSVLGLQKVELKL